MAKTLLSLEELKARAVQAIKRHDGCEEVSDITICEIHDDSARSNWRIGAVSVGPGCAYVATRAAVYVVLDKTCREVQHFAFGRPVTARARHAGGTAGASVFAFPRAAWVLFASPATVLALGAVHWESRRRFS
jgi:hypothetical protein